jgi:hypothetical protein
LGSGFAFEMSVAMKCLTYILLVVWFGVSSGCGSSSPGVDARHFRTDRKPLPDSASDAVILPRSIGSYDLQPTSGFLPAPAGTRQFVGLYSTPDGKQILLAAVLNPDKNFQQTALAQGNTCADVAGIATLYPEAPIPYGYTNCKTAHQFNWINGNWIMSALTYRAVDGLDLLQFVNRYTY